MTPPWPGKSVLDFDDPDPSPSPARIHSTMGTSCARPGCTKGVGSYNVRHGPGFRHAPQILIGQVRKKAERTNPPPSAAAKRTAQVLQDLGLQTSPYDIARAWKYDPVRRREIRDFVSRQAPSGLPLVYSGPTHDKSRNPGRLEIRSLVPATWSPKGTPIKLKGAT